jgi:hypothetical protein
MGSGWIIDPEVMTNDKKKPGFSCHDGLNVKVEKPGFCDV